MLAIGGAAGAASFTHVHNVAAAHGQPGWLAWADAIVLELMSIASGLELRRRKRAHTSTVFPATVLACAVTLSLAAQVVEAEPSVIGWITAAVPALGFLVMVKIALGRTSTATPAPALAVVDCRPDEAGWTRPDSGPDETVRSAVTAGERSSNRTVRSPDARRHGGGRERRRRADRGPSPQPSRAVAELLPAARKVRDRLAADGQALTRAALAEALRAAGHIVSNTRVSELLKALKIESSAPPGLIVSPVMPTDPTSPPLSPEWRGGGGAATPAPVDPDRATSLLPHNHPSHNQESLIMNSPTNPADQTTRTTTNNTTAPSVGQVWTIERVRALGVTTSLATTASVLGISRSQAYRLAATDQFPIPLIRAGSRIIVPVAALLHLLQPDPAATGGGRLETDAKVSVDAMTPPPADSTRHRWRHHMEHPGDDE